MDTHFRLSKVNRTDSKAYGMNVFHLCEAVRLTVGDILAGQVVSPCPDRPVDAGFLHIHAGGQEFR